MIRATINNFTIDVSISIKINVNLQEDAIHDQTQNIQMQL